VLDLIGKHQQGQNYTNNKLVSIQGRKNSEKYFYGESGMLLKRVLAWTTIDEPFTYMESYRYAIRK